MTSINDYQTTLHNGVTIPTLGYRIDKDNKERIYDDVLIAIEAGFRHFDLPCDHECEKIISKAIKDSPIPRYDLFLTMKLPNEFHGFQKAHQAFKTSIKNLDTDYADLYLVNWPNPIQYRDIYDTNSIETWQALEDIYKSGQARAIGLANFEARHIEHILESAEIAPMFNQARIYPGFPFKDNLDCANEHGIQTIGFLPPKHEDILNCKELSIFAEKYDATPRQICMRYLIDKGCNALCQGNDLNELKDSIRVFNFSMEKKDIKYLDQMKNYGLENINPDTCDF